MYLRKIVAGIVVETGLLALAESAEARQYTLPSGQIAHTRRAPVLWHRMFPPQLGKHVYVPARR